MNVDTLISILHLADPANNAPWGERMNALKQARRIMDHERISYASIGFSPEEAARIENQLAVAEPVAAPKHKWHWGFRTYRQAEQTEWRESAAETKTEYQPPAHGDYHYTAERDYQGHAPICLD